MNPSEQHERMLINGKTFILNGHECIMFCAGNGQSEINRAILLIENIILDKKMDKVNLDDNK